MKQLPVPKRNNRSLGLYDGPIRPEVERPSIHRSRRAIMGYDGSVNLVEYSGASDVYQDIINAWQKANDEHWSMSTLTPAPLEIDGFEEESFSDRENPIGTFIELATKIPGVVRVELNQGSNPQECILVIVEKGNREVRYAVYDLEGDIYARFPTVRLDVLVQEEVMNGDLVAVLNPS